jgi:preprotein translocase subunit SecE
MAMNREMKRRLQRQGQVGADGQPVAKAAKRRPAAAPPKPQAEERTSPTQFVREVRGELRKVAWPTRSEVVNYSIIVFVTVVILTSVIAALDYGIGEAVLKLFER